VLIYKMAIALRPQIHYVTSLHPMYNVFHWTLNPAQSINQSTNQPCILVIHHSSLFRRGFKMHLLNVQETPTSQRDRATLYDN